MLFGEIIALCAENHTTPKTTLCGQNAELLIVKECGIHSYRWVLKRKNKLSVTGLALVENQIKKLTNIRRDISKYEPFLCGQLEFLNFFYPTVWF
jgi:hypothetical protein